MAKFVCPYCIKGYNQKKILYVCPDCGETAVPDRFEKEPIKCKKTSCGGLATQRKCPLCGGEIPKTALETSNLPFSIVGVSNSGKTNFITVMLHELSRGNSGIRLALGAQNKETRDHQEENYKSIYEDHIPPPSTAGGERMPQIWYIKNLSKKRGNNVPTYTFTVFDGAGEDHENNLDRSSPVCRYIETSKAIILTLDPLILANIRKGGIVDEKTMKNSLAGDTGQTKNAADVINSVANYIKTARGIKVTKKLKIPIAVVLTKFDTIISHPEFGEEAVIKKSGSNVRAGKVSMEDIQMVHDEIESWLRNIGEGSFIDAIDANFNDFHFFGVSSYGSPPEAAARLCDKINPHRVLDPVMWLFKKAKFID
jgi:hypothetical protein